MQQVKQTAEYTVFQKKSGRYAVQANAKGKKWLNGDDKVRILVDEQLVKVMTPKAPPAEAPAEEASAAS
ncbi:hypothetical protein [uncultured Lamprocystis sp.]|jgi:hypothetical protein|uniref:hypothetical protein n=1 Tax=uncultured Lamprocystis sp. TaxID=543132 RepID=UPI0025F3EF40|nr:hypothetical protein [uncultured Lamprocystis sp.]